MDRSFHYLLLAAQGLFQRTAMSELSGMDLTEEQYRVLDYLGQHDGSFQEYVAAGSQLDPAAAAEALSQLEQKIAYARQFYNDVVLKFNTAIETVPSNIIAGLFHFTQAQYFEADEQSRQVPQVSFSK